MNGFRARRPSALLRRGGQGVPHVYRPSTAVPLNQLHRVHRLVQLPVQVLKIENHQGPPTIRILEAEASPWWCDQRGLQLDVPGRHS